MDVTWGIALLIVGLTITIVAATEEGTPSTVLFTVGLLLLLAGVALLGTSRRR